MATSTSFWKIAFGVGCGILLAVGLVFGVVAASCTALVGSVATGMAESEDARLEALASIEFEEVEGRRDGDFFKIRGYVRNNGDTSVDFVKVGVELLNENGDVLDTDWSFAVSGEGLDPGGRKSFDIMTRTSSGVTNFKYFIKTD